MPSAAVAAASNGANAIVAAPGAGLRITVTGYVLVGSGAVTAKWVSGSTDKTGAMLFASSTVVSAPRQTRNGRDGGWFDCGDNEALNLTLNTTVAVNGHVAYEVNPSGS